MADRSPITENKLIIMDSKCAYLKYAQNLSARYSRIAKKVHEDYYNGFSRADLYLGLHRQGFRPPTKVLSQPKYE